MERWRSIPGWEGYYEASDQGRVRSVERMVRARHGLRTSRSKVLRPRPHRRSGHLEVWLSRGGQVTQHWVHHLVLETFVGPRPPEWECRHLDGNPSNNQVSNLAWGTHRQNMLDKVAHGTDHYRERTHCKNGHEYNENNTRWAKRGGRECRACVREAHRRRRAKEIR